MIFQISAKVDDFSNIGKNDDFVHILIKIDDVSIIGKNDKIFKTLPKLVKIGVP